MDDVNVEVVVSRLICLMISKSCICKPRSPMNIGGVHARTVNVKLQLIPLNLRIQLDSRLKHFLPHMLDPLRHALLQIPYTPNVARPSRVNVGYPSSYDPS
jgi:hypothetical protein